MVRKMQLVDDRYQPPIDKKGGPPHDGGGSEPPMELVERVAHLEDDMRDVRERLVKIEGKMDHFAEAFATKADLHQAINAQTWKLVTFVCGFGTALAGAVYFIATHVK